MAKSTEDRLAYLERFNARLLRGLSRHFALTLEEDDPSAPQEGEEGLFDKMTVAELKVYATANSIDLGDAKTKADIIAAIELAKE